MIVSHSQKTLLTLRHKIYEFINTGEDVPSYLLTEYWNLKHFLDHESMGDTHHGKMLDKLTQGNIFSQETLAKVSDLGYDFVHIMKKYHDMNEIIQREVAMPSP